MRGLVQKKDLGIAVVIVFLGLPLVCCQRLFPSPPPSHSMLQLSGTECLPRVGKAFHNYMSANSSVKEVDDSFSCLDSTLDLFLSRVQAQSGGVYSAEFLQRFLQREFPNSDLKPGFVRDTLKLKALVLGGNSNVVTREELLRLRRDLALIQTECKNLLPYLGVVFGDEKATLHGIEKALLQLNQSADNLRMIFLAGSQKASLADIGTFLDDISRGDASLDWFLKHTALISATKAFFLHDPGDSIASSDLADLLCMGARIFGLSLIQQKYLSSRDVLFGAGLQGLLSLMDGALDTIELAIRNKKDAVIHFREIDELVKQAYAFDLWPNPPLSETSFLDLLRPLLTRVFNPEYAVYGGERIPDGVTLLSAEKMREEFHAWAQMQQSWELLEKRSGNAPNSAIDFDQIERIWPHIPSDFRQTKEELNRLLLSSLPLSFSPTGTVVFLPRAQLRMNREGFTSLNWKRWIVHAAIQGFATDPKASRWDGLDEIEFASFFKALNKTAVELRLVAPNDEKTWKSSYQEAKVFLFSSRGQAKLGFFEGVELTAFAISSSRLSKVAFRDMSSRCEKFGADDFGLPKFTRLCFFTNLDQQLLNYYGSISGWRNFMQILSPSAKKELTWNFLRATYRNSESDQFSDSNDIDRNTAIMQYIESLLLRFGDEGHEFIDLEGAKSMFPVIKALLIREGNIPEDHAWAVFTYLLAKQKVPGAFDVLLWEKVGSLSIANYGSEFGKWPVHCDRACLLNAIAAFNEVSGNRVPALN